MATVFRLLEVSPQHLPAELRDTDALRAGLRPIGGATVDRVQYGWLIYLPIGEKDEVAALSGTLQTLVIHADHYGARYILIDEEHDTLDGDLPSFP